MKRVTSFKAQYRQAPVRAVTPPPPAWEPLSPVLRPSDPSAVRPAQPLPPHSLPLGSPIGVLADAAVSSQRPSAAYVEPPRRAFHAGSAPSTGLQPTSERAPKHAFATGHTHSNHERPAKRARSEYHTSPPYGQPQSRPATSHIPGYNVEHMVDSGMRMYQDSRANAPPQMNGGGDKMLSDAELLLFFSNVSAHTAQTPPSTAKRWSVSQPSPPELPLQQAPQMHASLSPRAAVTHTISDQTLHQHGPLDVKPPTELPPFPSDTPNATSTSQTRTPPAEAVVNPVAQPSMPEVAPAEEPKPKKQQGGPKGRSRGTRNTPSTGKRKRSTPKPKNAPSASTSAVPDQLQSPQSLPADQSLVMANVVSQTNQQSHLPNSHNRRHSFSTPSSLHPSDAAPSLSFRAQSVPLGGEQVLSAPAADLRQPAKKTAVEQPDLICAACKSTESEIKVGDGEQWIGCDGCKEWYHYACAGFNSEREVRDVNKFYCDPCRPKFGETTKVRKSVRAHTTVDYAGLNEGVLKTSDDNPEHHYIAAFKNGDLEFTPETFARMPPEMVTADFLHKSNGFREPILVPGALNSRTTGPSTNVLDPALDTEQTAEHTTESVAQFDYETTADVGQDKLDMVIPEGLTVRRVAELYGANELVPVIDVKAQEGEGKKWTMSKWADYYEQQGEKPVRNVISLEVSRSRLGKLIRRPKAVRDMDLQDSVWREDDKSAPPPVQFYCLMSVADCFTDFHIDFGGSSVYYHIVKGRKVFFFIPPTKQNLKKYEDWCLSPNQGHDWLGKQVKECYRVDLYPGDTMLIPSGWIHAVWTPEDSLVIGGNFLTRIHYGMQIKILEIEKNTKVALQFRYPFFQKIMWLTVIKYLEEDPVPDSVRQYLESGEQFKRPIPIYCEPDKFGHNSDLGSTNYNRRYYSKHELEGLTDLLNYIWRTVLISLDKIDVPQKTRGAVTRSIPKGHGDPLALAKRFAIWIAWKRGNETIPSWAMPDANLPETAEAGEKKLSAAQVKKMERDSLHEALRATAERSSARIRAPPPQPVREPSPVNYNSPPPDGVEDVLQFDMTPVSAGPLTGFLRPSANNPHITTPKTSQLGPKRVACDACRKRRIRCKHKDELIDTSKPGMHTIDLSGSYGISVKRRLSDHSIADGQTSVTSGPVNGGPIMADVNGDPYALKSGRVKACADCRKSKRRCIHDEYGNVDIIKANEVPIPRGSASKRRRVSDENSNSSTKRKKHGSSFEDDYMNGDMHARHSLPNQFSVGSSLLQDIAFSAQQALARDEDDLVPVDPALQAYANGAYSAMEMAPSYASNGNGIMSSIEQQAEGDMQMSGSEYATQNGGLHGPSIEPLTLGPPPHNDTAHAQSNGYTAPDPLHVKTNGFAHRPSHNNAVRRPSSPVSPRQMSAISPGMYNHNAYMTSPSMNHNHNNHDYNFTTDSDFPPPPTTPAAKTHAPTNKTPRASKTPKSTPCNRHAEGIKLEAGIGVGMMMDVDMIDPSLDQASIDLIKQLQQEDLGLRRRSR
ncbi:hypothetical protein HBI56_226790 [Parastagonospora nodorum]|nr:hypothetical protein HBH46_238450 [Parastagonospora nodorum]KAH5139518.1 hypothetical protein HBH69_215430 [Parastagonospora nodorum]KAH5168883.1 hypothetical protein HBH77_233100 [Parastagonospora nodorum]KAH5170721.1 hypothetical protein HBH68_216830 [Parastagonospora nodorum]KAH5342451.1 hypothetical protein HBI48_224410 [Parastagonospora nodorum]